MKTCTQCHESKPETLEFWKKGKGYRNGLRSMCKVCAITEQREKRAQNKQKYNEKRNKYLKENPDKLKKWSRTAKSNYRKKLQADPEFAKKERKRINDKSNRKYQEDPCFRIVRTLRSRVYKAINGNYKSGSAIRDLGCSIEELKKHLESQFQEGMTWDNHGKWHIDHIKPLASFDLTCSKEFKKACHYSNLQPLWAEDNLKKGSKYSALNDK